MNDTKQTSKAPAFSVIMPTYNRAFCIKTAIDSLLNQTYQQFELIIVDDGSTDRTEQLIQKSYQKYLKSGKFKYIKLKHVGVSAARNVGIKEAKNEWITYLDTDNYLLSNALGVYSYNILKNPKQQNFYGKFIAKTTKEVFGKLFNFEDIKKQNTIDLGVYLHTKNLVEKCGAFDETLKRFVDWEMIARHCAYSHPILINEIVMEYNDSTKIKRITTTEKYSDTYVKAYEKINKLVKNTIKEKHEEQENVASCFFKIIIPNYNNMPYIQQCLDSILNQTFQDFKIIVVDDLSTDGSDKFCEMYARKYPDKINVLKMKAKGHEGGARNAGINYKYILSKYTYFVDGDDMLYSKQSLQILYDNLKNNDLDILLFNMIQLINGIYVQHGNKNEVFIENSKNNALTKWNSASAKIVKSTFITPFLENCDHGADAYQFITLLDKKPKIKQINNIIYTYRRNPHSLTMSTTSTRYADDTQLFYTKLSLLLLTLKTESVRSAVLYRIKLFNEGIITR